MWPPSFGAFKSGRDILILGYVKFLSVSTNDYIIIIIHGYGVMNYR